MARIGVLVSSAIVGPESRLGVGHGLVAKVIEPVLLSVAAHAYSIPLAHDISYES